MYTRNTFILVIYECHPDADRATGNNDGYPIIIGRTPLPNSSSRYRPRESNNRAYDTCTKRIIQDIHVIIIIYILYLLILYKRTEEGLDSCPDTAIVVRR